jgi:F-type H+-transporting ATPase subunit delta
MTAASDRLSDLDGVLDGLSSPAEALPDELFSLVDALDSTPTLRRVLADAATPEDDRVALVANLLAGRSAGAVTVATEAVKQHWPGGRRLADALERQAVRAQLLASGDVDDVEDELFRLARLVDANPGLRNALADQARSLADRQDLVSGLITDRAAASTVKLARRAVAVRSRTFSATVETYVDLAAQLRNRTVATVRVARQLDADQLGRLKTALSRQVGRDVSLQQIIDPEVLGGIRVEFGDEVIEGTIAARVTEARRHFET